jgi:hypothetical protein
MTNSEIVKQAQQDAQSKIESRWRDVAEKYTVAWGGPLGAVEMMFPHISDAISGIRSQVRDGLPLIIYQTRESSELPTCGRNPSPNRLPDL